MEWVQQLRLFSLCPHKVWCASLGGADWRFLAGFLKTSKTTQPRDSTAYNEQARSIKKMYHKPTGQSGRGNFLNLVSNSSALFRNVSSLCQDDIATSQYRGS